MALSFSKDELRKEINGKEVKLRENVDFSQILFLTIQKVTDIVDK